jgi:hypothetical protein
MIHKSESWFLKTPPSSPILDLRISPLKFPTPPPCPPHHLLSAEYRRPRLILASLSLSNGSCLHSSKLGQSSSIFQESCEASTRHKVPASDLSESSWDSEQDRRFFSLLKFVNKFKIFIKILYLYKLLVSKFSFLLCLDLNFHEGVPITAWGQLWVKLVKKARGFLFNETVSPKICPSKISAPPLQWYGSLGLITKGKNR